MLQRHLIHSTPSSRHFSGSSRNASGVLCAAVLAKRLHAAPPIAIDASFRGFHVVTKVYFRRDLDRPVTSKSAEFRG